MCTITMSRKTTDIFNFRTSHSFKILILNTTNINFDLNNLKQMLPSNDNIEMIQVKKKKKILKYKLVLIKKQPLLVANSDDYCRNIIYTRYNTLLFTINFIKA